MTIPPSESLPHGTSKSRTMQLSSSRCRRPYRIRDNVCAIGGAGSNTGDTAATDVTGSLALNLQDRDGQLRDVAKCYSPRPGSTCLWASPGPAHQRTASILKAAPTSTRGTMLWRHR